MSDITLYGHRGGGDPYPDSSIESYQWGINWGADFIEPDLYLTKDGVLVVSHDNIAGGFANLTYAQALALNPALLTFDQLIDFVKEQSIETGRQIGLIPETKSTDYATSEAVIKALIAHGFTDPNLVYIQSFSATNLQWLHDTIMPEYGVDFNLVQLTTSISNPTQVATYADVISPSIGSFTAADVAAAHAAGLQVVAWTITGAESDLQNLINMNVDGVFADNIQLARPGEEDINGIKVIYGTTQWDVTAGTAGADMIYAMQGDDIVRAGDGNDTIYGDAGNDVLFGGAGNDLIVGGGGSDFLAGGAGTNVLDGSAGNDVIVATGNGDHVLFRTGGGIDLVSANATTVLNFSDAKSTDVSVVRDGTNLVIRINANDALVIRDSNDAAHLPASVTFADGVTWSTADLLAHATVGTDAQVEAALPGLEYVLANAPTLAEPSTVAIGADLVAGDGFGSGTLSEQVAQVEKGAVYHLTFSLADLPTGDDGVRVMWGGQVLYEGTPGSTATEFHFNVVGGAGDRSNQLVFQSTSGTSFGAALDDVHFVKVSDPGVPVPNNTAPAASDSSVLVSQDIAITGKLVATDADGDILVYSLGDGPQHGTVTIKADGTYQYTPGAGYTGNDGFTYLVSDGHGGVSEATMSLSVKPGIVIGTDLIVNGSFEDLALSTGNNGSGDWGYRNANGIITGWTDVNGNRVEQHWDTLNGVSARDGTIYIDMDGYNTNTHLVQQIAHVETGATYSLTFSVSDVDTAVSNDGIRVLFGGQVIYEGIPTGNWQTLTFSLTGGSGDGSNKLEFVATGTGLNTYGAGLDDVHFVKVADAGATLPDNHAPVATDGSAEGDQDKIITGKLTATDADGDAPLAFGLNDGPAHGTVVVNADGTYTYTPTAGYHGTDAFTFTVSDGHGGTDTATQSLIIDQVAKNLIVNGGFEDLTGASDAATWGYRNTNPAGVIAGWTNTSDTRAEVHKDTVGGISAHEGTYWFDMEGAPKNATLVQTVAGVETGSTYQLTFSIADTDTAQTNDTIQVYWGNQLIYTGIPLAAWQDITIDVVGGAGNGSNQLKFASTTPSANGAGVALDNVSMIKIDGNPNLIVNGSFEDLTGANDGSATSSDWGFRNDSGIIPGWKQINTAAGGRAEIHHDTQNGVSAKDGNYWYDLDGNKNNAKLVQTVTGVQTGKTYELKFSIADADGTNADDGVKVYWGGVLIYTGLPTNQWQEITLHVVGGAGDGSNQLEFDGNETNLSGTGAALDAVSLRLINSAPVAVADALPSVDANGQPVFISFAALLGNDTDVDLDQLTVTAVNSAVGGSVVLQQGGILFTPNSGFIGQASFQYTISDGQGGTSAADASFAVGTNIDIAAGQFRTTPISVTGTTQISVEGILSVADAATRAIDAKTALPSGDSLTVNVSASGQIMSGDDAIRVNKDLANGHITIDNAGSIMSMNGQAIDLVGVVSTSTTITITNEATGRIMATNADAIRPGANSVIENYGQIIASTQVEDKNDAIDFQDNGSGMVNNHSGGVISGARHGITGTHGVTVTNEVGATIIGNSGSAVNIDNGANGETVFVVNRGSMIGAAQASYTDSDGDAIDTDGILHLDNYGEVKGLGAFGYHDGGANVSEGIAAGGGVINNYAGGEIYGYGRAIQIDDSNTGPALSATTIYNEGLIQGDGHGPAGVSAADAAAMQAQIDGREAIDIVGSFDDTITNKGRIVGGIFTDGGNDSLINTGTIAGKVDMGDGNDTVTLGAGSHVTGTILLGAGDDTLDASASTSTVIIDGITVANAVTVDGGAGNDQITGSAGNDVIRGGTGNDALAGGDGSDTYVYASGDGVDTITEGAGRSGDSDSLVFTDLADGSVTLYRHGSDLDIVTADGGKITVTGQFAGTAGDGIESVVFGNGVTFDHDAIAAHLTDRGPVAADVALPTVNEDAASFLVSFDTLLAGASDADLDHLSISAIGDLVGGTAVMTADGVRFTLTADYNGAASFSFTVDDGRGGTTVAHASFDVTPVNDAPVVTPVAPVVTDEDTVVTGQIVASDVDGDTLVYGIKGEGAANGSVSIDAHGNWTYTPDANYHGADSFVVTVFDGTTTVEQVVGLTVNSVNDAPVAVNDTGHVQEHDTAVFDLTGNDTDVEDGHPHLVGFSVTGVDGVNVSTSAATAAFQIVNGQLQYTGGNIFGALNDGDHATVTLSYTAEDNDGGHATGQFVLTIDGHTDLNVITGTGGSDTLIDTIGADHIVAGDGNDVISSNFGNDVIDAGSGNDTVFLLAGDKVVNGGDGNDTIFGGTGDSTLNGDDGNDTILGGSGNEIINGGAGNDTLTSGTGNDIISGGDGNDTIYGSVGNSVLNGNAGNDTIIGGLGNETINGGDGNDLLMGNAGNDVIAGGAGNDQLFGGIGSDTFVFKVGDGQDMVFDFQAQGTGHDVIELDHAVFADYQALMNSGAVHDAMGGVQIAYADGSTLTLTGVSKASLNVDDFRFA